MPSYRTRTIAARVCAVLAAVLLPLGMVASWVAGVLSDTPAYVDAVGPLASDPVVRKAAEKHLSAQAVKLVDVSSRNPQLGEFLGSFGYGELGESLDEITSGLTEAFRPEIELAVKAVVVGIVEGPTFEPAWREANRSAHEQLVDILEGRRGIVLDDEGRVSIELGTVLNSISLALGRRGIPTDTTALPTVDTSFSLIKGSDLEKARGAYRTLNTLGFWLPVLTLVLLAAALALSPRRWTTVRTLGIGGAVAVLALLLLLVWGRSAVAGSSGDPEVAKALWDVVTSSLRTSALVALGVTVLAALAGAWLARPAAPAAPAAAAPAHPAPRVSPEDVW